ncbi:MAG TPA: hypothetical protein VN645_02500 [Steroidobacteraceae bacterium]|nr:hypothetical protein [Steroidobacteraceae bacterium]
MKAWLRGLTMIKNPLLAVFAIAALLQPFHSFGASAPNAARSAPDFSGVWMAFAAETPGGGGNSPGYTSGGKARLDQFKAQYTEIPETGIWCLGAGMPGMMLSMVSYPITIVQTPKLMAMLAELEMQRRLVYLDGRPHDETLLPSSTGHSVGKWEGNALVIDTVDLSEWQLAPWPRSEDTHITERVSMTKLGNIKARPSGFVADAGKPLNDDVLVFDMTLTDPGYYSGPQRRVIYYQRMPDTATLEYQCTYEHWSDELEKKRKPGK